MDSFFSPLIWGLFLPLTNDGRELPDANEVQVRLLFVRPGMTEAETKHRLRLVEKKRTGAGNLKTWTWFYQIEPQHYLILRLRYDDDRKWKLTEARLELDRNE